jgi:hypothetical protein
LRELSPQNQQYVFNIYLYRYYSGEQLPDIVSRQLKTLSRGKSLPKSLLSLDN